MSIRFPSAFISALLFSPLAMATTYNCSPITVPGGGNSVVAQGINNVGVIVGNYQLNAIRHGFISNPSTGNFQTVDYPQPPGSTNTQLFTINNKGVSLGFWQNNQNGASGYFTLDSAGNFKTIAPPSPYTHIQAYGINDNGAVSVFVSQTSGNATFGILNPNGTLTPVPGWDYNNPSAAPLELAYAASLNNSNQMVVTSDSYGGFGIASPSGLVNPPVFTGAPQYAYGINNLGIIAGYLLTPMVHEPPYVDFTYNLSSSTFSQVICPAINASNQPVLYAINDNGVLAGQSVATPLPGTAQLTLSTNNVVFPATPVGQTTPPQPVTIKNTGNARLDMFAIGNLTFSIAPNPAALFHADTGCFANADVVTSLNPGASCTMMISATPSKQGQQTGSESFYNSGPGSPQAMALSVTGTAPPPTCSIATTSTGVSLTLQDTNSGLKSIALLSSTNAAVNIPSFTPGTTSPVTATASQVNTSEGATVDLQATNVGGGVATCGTPFGRTPNWTGLGGAFNSGIATATNSNGRVQAFVRGTDNALWTIAQTAPDGAWSVWTKIGGVLGSDPAVGRNADGRLDVFALGSDGSLWHVAQTSPGAAFSGWQGLGNKLAGAPSVAANADGRLQVFARGADSALWTIAQSSPNGSWGSWTSLGGNLLNGTVSALTNNGGSMEVFVIGTDSAVWHRWQLSPGGSWANWSTLGGTVASLTAVINIRNGLVDLVGTGSDQAVWSLSHVYGTGWGAWQSLGGTFTSAPSAVFDANGMLEIFVRSSDRHLFESTATQAGPPFAFSNWTSLGGALLSAPSAVLNQDGRVAAFVEGTDETLWTIAQSQPGFW